MAHHQYGLGFSDSYVVDTSSLVDLRFEQEPAKIVDGLCLLVKEGRLKTVSWVIPELERMVGTKKFEAGYLRQFKSLRQMFVLKDAELIIEAGRIMHRYPKLGKVFDARNCADPWIVAAGKLLGLTVITEEADTGERKTHKIPYVCDQEGVKWERLHYLVATEDLG